MDNILRLLGRDVRLDVRIANIAMRVDQHVIDARFAGRDVDSLLQRGAAGSQFDHRFAFVGHVAPSRQEHGKLRGAARVRRQRSFPPGAGILDIERHLTVKLRAPERDGNFAPGLAVRAIRHIRKGRAGQGSWLGQIRLSYLVALAESDGAQTKIIARRNFRPLVRPR